MSADDDDDPIFALVRDARPAAPPTLARDVLARLDARRPRRAPLVIGALVGCAAIVCAVLLLRHDDAPRVVATRELDARIDVPAVAPDAMPVDATAAPADWTNLPALWAELDRAHRAPLAACRRGFPMISIHVGRARDGTTQASHPVLGNDIRDSETGPTPGELCVVRVVEGIQLPPLPADVQSLGLAMPIPEVPLPAEAMDAWRDPARTVREALDVHADALRRCAQGTKTLLVFVDRGRSQQRIWLPRYQFATDRAHEAAITACTRRVFAKVALPAFPPVLGEVQLDYRIPQ